MAVIKVACPKCGQKVSGDESFYDKYVNCPICTSKIMFPANPSIPRDQPPPASSTPPPQGSAPPPGNDPFPTQAPSHGPQPGAFDEAPPQASQAHSSGPDYMDVPQRTVPTSPGAAGDEVPSPLLGSISLVIGILNIVSLCFLSIILVPAAIICGHIALAKAKQSPVKPAPGQTHAVIGVILGYAGLVFTLTALLVALLFKDQIQGITPPTPNG